MEKIDVRDLSVGDWVCAEQLCGVGNEPRLTPAMRVVSLGLGAGGWVNLVIDPEQGDPFEYEPSEIRGIEITKEILEQNGFVKNLGIYYHSEVLFELERVRDTWHRTFSAGEYDLYEIKYVHQLQHALRLAKVDKEIEL